ncbi:MAG: OB-fold nucleic acid binding domain-containing protein [Myxococcaceae bacterium]
MNQPAPPADETSPPAEETVRKVYVRDLREKQPVFTVFRVSRKSRQTSRNGKSFLVLGFADRTGEVDGRVFDRVEALENAFHLDDYVLVKGQVVSFHGKPQVIAESLERLDPEPIDASEFALPVPPTPEAPVVPEPAARAPGAAEPRPQDGGRTVVQIRELVEHVDDPHVKALLLAFLEDKDIALGLPVAPAAKGTHHAYRGGLAEHLLSVMRLSQRLADHYPMLDRDLLLAGALLQGIGRVSELAYANGGVAYTDQGRLVGHAVTTAQALHAKAGQIPGFPQALEQHLTHLVIAEHGSPQSAVTLEAYAVHALAELDAQLAGWLEAMAKDPNDSWAEPTRLTERPLFKGTPPTRAGRSPVGARRRRRGRGGRERPIEREGSERKERESLPVPRLTLPPLESLTGSTPTADGSEDPAQG